jgi:HEPN domain-containing protein
MPAASFVMHSTKASCSMANPRRAKSLLELAEEDLAGARLLLEVSTRLARYHVQQCAEKAVKALFEHLDLNPGREHRFGALAEMLPQSNAWQARVRNLDTLSPAATTLRYPTAEGRILPQPPRNLVEGEIATAAQLVQDVKKTISAAPDQQRSVERKPVASEHERKSALARRIVSVARLKGLKVPDNAEEKLAIHVDERVLSMMLKDILTASSFQDMLDARSVTIPKDDNS